MNTIISWVAIAWQWVNDSAAALSAMATILTAVFAVVALVNASRDSRDRSRPYILAEFRQAEHSDSAIDLVVRNAGTSMARKVAVTFDPVPEVPDDGTSYVTPFLLERYKQQIPSVAPGQTLTNVWWTGRQGSGPILENAEPTTEQVDVSVSYEDDRGRLRYEDQFSLDVRMLLCTTTSTSSTSLKGRLKTIDASLKKTAIAMATVAQSANRSSTAGSHEPDETE